MSPVNIAIKHKTQEDLLNREERQRKGQDTLSFSVSQKANIIIDQQIYLTKMPNPLAFIMNKALIICRNKRMCESSCEKRKVLDFSLN